MDTALEILRHYGTAAVRLLSQPFYYFALLLIILSYIRQTRTERKLFHVRLHAWPKLLGRAVWSGLLAGAALSAGAAFIGMSLTPSAALWLWGTAALLMLVRVRYLCFAYSAGVLGLLQWLSGLLGLPDGTGSWLGRAALSLENLDIPGLLLLVAGLHAAEALLVRRDGARFSSPLFLEGKRGKLIGGYALQGYWPVPLLLLVPSASAAASLPWTPLLGGSAWEGGWTVIALPAIIGFTDLTRSELPKLQARLTSRRLLAYSAVLAAAALGAAYAQPLVPVAALLSLGLHEALIVLGSMRERQRQPRFVHDERGLCILGVVPGTPAEEMGLEAGEVLHKVNGKKVRTKEDLHAALHINSAFCRMEVFNADGQLKFLQRARYAGEHHQLGVLLAPDEDAGYYAAPAHVSVLGLLRRSRAARRRVRKDTTM
ncbi:PDZ domain-containing protein [Paenibacillus sp. P22]|uniref:PDZ domain-containing protein n=1 Tax=Paenibacillus sp. P22 TaxID=483908 RepID=UPI00040B4769|nr:PDZ domain-containing protein [Paenibacillus sp. P22]CDN43465.1 Cell division topological determinant [Paenibacillus sp. P22]